MFVGITPKVGGVHFDGVLYASYFLFALHYTPIFSEAARLVRKPYA